MKKLQFTLALASILLITACHNSNSSTSQEPRDETPAMVHEHDEHSTMEEHKPGGATENKPMAEDTISHKDTMSTPH